MWNRQGKLKHSKVNLNLLSISQMTLCTGFHVESCCFQIRDKSLVNCTPKTKNWVMCVQWTFMCTPFGELLPFTSANPVPFEASTITHTEGENKACSTLASLPHKPSIDEQEENRRTEEIKGRMGVEVILTEGWEKGSAGPLMHPATLHHQAANDGWIKHIPVIEMTWGPSRIISWVTAGFWGIVRVHVCV